MEGLDARRGGWVAVAVLLWLGAACGNQTNPETVYLKVFNGYPGSRSMSLYGPSGTVTSQLPFGKRTGDFVPVDRNLGTNFKLVLEGAPQPFDVELPLYNLYPQESATVFFKRRTGADTVDEPQVFRHIQTGYSEEQERCRLIFDNGLSLQNDGLAQFNYVPVFKIQPECTGYLSEIGTFKDAQEGFTVETEAGNEIPISRPDLYDKIQNNPWFIATSAGEGEVLDVRNAAQCGAFSPRGGSNRIRVSAGANTFTFTWAVGADIDYQSGNFRARAPTRQYMNCIGWDPDKPKDKQKIRSEQVYECRRSPGTTKPVQLGEELVSYRFPTGIGYGEGRNRLNDQCGFRVSVRSDFRNVFEDPKEGPSPKVRSTVKYDPNQYYFWILYGRPVNPKIEHWGANTPGRGGGFVKLPSYPGAK